MDRNEHLLKHVTKAQRGIEIGPWFNPVAPRRAGFDCLALDVFDTATLRARAAADANIAHRAEAIEEVDFVGSSTEIDSIVAQKYALGSFDYIVSSHNFEHLANPIRFLKACARVLKPGGMVSMAIPDHRACFDFFKPLTMLTDWIGAYVDARDRPTPLQIFHHAAFFAMLDDGKQATGSFFRFSPVDKIVGPTNLQDVYADFLRRTEAPDGDYVDAHCSTFTPSSFELLIVDCVFLGLIPFEITEIADLGSEFHAHLRVVGEPLPVDRETHRSRRDRLMHRMKDEEAEASVLVRDATALMAERDALRVAIAQMKESTSWKVTAPLRWAATTVRGLRSSAAAHEKT